MENHPSREGVKISDRGHLNKMFKICSGSGVGKAVRMDYDELDGGRFAMTQEMKDKG
jgi:hypothetical protein